MLISDWIKRFTLQFEQYLKTFWACAKISGRRNYMRLVIQHSASWEIVSCFLCKILFKNIFNNRKTHKSRKLKLFWFLCRSVKEINSTMGFIFSPLQYFILLGLLVFLEYRIFSVIMNFLDRVNENLTCWLRAEMFWKIFDSCSRSDVGIHSRLGHLLF